MFTCHSFTTLKINLSFFISCCSQLSILWKDVWGELHGGLHVTLDLHFSLHESLVAVELAGSHGHNVLVQHNESCIGLAMLALLGAHLEEVDSLQLVDDWLALRLQDSVHPIEK